MRASRRTRRRAGADESWRGMLERSERGRERLERKFHILGFLCVPGGFSGIIWARKHLKTSL